MDKIIEQISALYIQKEKERYKEREMEKNEIKKALYKEKPAANFVSAGKDGLVYTTIIREVPEPQRISFLIPYSDIGDAIFYPDMDAKLLIRYLI
jgi:hypothetical protein